MKKSRFIVLITLMLLAMSASVAFAETDTSENTWVFNSETGLITNYYGSGNVVTVPDEIDGVAVTGIAYMTFANHREITDVIIPEGVTHIDGHLRLNPSFYQAGYIPLPPYANYEGAFSNCVNLQNVTLPSTLVTIGSSVFYNCQALESITIPDSVQTIGVGAFRDCRGLKSVKLSAGLKEISAETFIGCNALEQIEIPEGVEKINGGSRFEPTTASSNFGSYRPYVNGQILSYSGAFSSCDKLKDISLPATLTEIGDYTFSDCTSLESITIPDSVQTIGEGVFMDCEALTDVKLPTALTELADGVFSNCKALKQIEIPESVEKISGSTKYTQYYSSDDISSATSFSYKPFGAFTGCTALEELNIPKNVSSLSGLAFANYPYVKVNISEENSNYFFKDGILFADGGATLIYAPDAAGEFVVPEGVTAIGSAAFYGNDNITGVTIPKTVKSIGDYAFYGNAGLASLTICEGVEEIGLNAFRYCTALENVEWPASAKRINNNVFTNCEDLKKIVIPAEVEKIGLSVFSGTPDGFTIYGYKDTTAHRYATGSYDFVDLENPDATPTPVPYTIYPPTPDIESGMVAYGTKVAFTPVSGYIIYSVNGSDTRSVWSIEPMIITITEDTTITVQSGIESFIQYYTPTATYTYTVDPTTIPSYIIKEIGMESEDGESLNKVPEDSDFIIRVKCTRKQELREEDCFIAALYDTDGVLVGVYFNNENIDFDTDTDIRFNIPSQDKAIGVIKAYVWDGFDSMNPLAESISLIIK